MAYRLVSLDTQPDTYLIASFITYIGARIYNSLPCADASDKKKLSKVLKLMEKHCVGDTNVTYERFLLERRRQEEGEPFGRYLTVIRDITSRCQYGDKTEEVLSDKIVCGVNA